MKLLAHTRFRYLKHNSILHRVDPLSKLLLVTLFSFGVYFFQFPQSLLLIVPIPFLISIFLGRVKPLTVLSTFFLFYIFGSLVFIFQLMAHQTGALVTQVGPLNITKEGLQIGLLFLLRIATVGCSALLFVWTTKPKDFAVSLTYLRIPYRPVFAGLVGLRLLPLFEDEIRKINEAHLIRGIKQRSGVMGAFERWQRYMLPVLASALRNSENVAVAMESRGFGLFQDRTYAKPFQWTRSGLLLLLIILIYFVLVGYLLGGVGFTFTPRYKVFGEP
jgi:energy-coupling factor transport system permease protein